MDLMKVGEIEQQYPKEWVLVEVVREHNDYRRVVGRLLAHSPNRDDLNEPYWRFRKAHPHGRTMEYYTGPVEIDADVCIIL